MTGWLKENHTNQMNQIDSISSRSLKMIKMKNINKMIEKSIGIKLLRLLNDKVSI